MAAADTVGAQDEGLLRDLANSPRARVARYKQWFEQSHRRFSPWRTNCIEDWQFLSNDQWPDSKKEDGRVRLVINKILPKALFLLGLQRQQKLEPKLLPFERGDARLTELMGALYKWVGTRSKEKTIDAKVFGDKALPGLGYWKLGVDFDKDPEGLPIWQRPSPLSIFPDPNWPDIPWDNILYCQHATWFTLEQALAEWPQHRDEIRSQYGEWLNEYTATDGSQVSGGAFAGDAVSDERLWWDPETQRARIVEGWYYQRLKVTVAFNPVTNEATADPERVDLLREALKREPGLKEQIKFVQRTVKRVYVHRFLNDTLLSDDPSPYDEQVIPIFPSVGFYWWQLPFGIVRPMKDPQTEKNKRRSSITEMVIRSALSGWYNQESTGARTSDLENYAAGIAKVINYKSVQPVEIQPPQLPQAVVFLDAQSDRDMDAVSNIHAELLGNTTQRTVSGRAIMARQQSGITTQSPLLETFLEDKEPAVKFMISLIKQFISVPKAVRILGTIAARAKEQQAPPPVPGQPAPEPPAYQQMLDQNDIAAIETLLSEAFSTEYDVVVGSKPWEPSLMQQRWQVIQGLSEQYGELVPPKVMTDAAVNAGVLEEDVGDQIAAWAERMLAMREQQAAGPMGPPQGTA